MSFELGLNDRRALVTGGADSLNSDCCRGPANCFESRETCTRGRRPGHR
jgi:hypothetical protein